MNVQKMTLQEIRRVGLAALDRELGMVGMIRFLQQGDGGFGDYTKERKRLLGKPSVSELVEEILTDSQR